MNNQLTFTGCVRALERGLRFTVHYRNGDIAHYKVDARSQNYVVASAAKPRDDALIYIGERVGDSIRLTKINQAGASPQS